VNVDMEEIDVRGKHMSATVRASTAA